MAQKSKAASLTPDLLTSRNVSTQATPRKQATDLSLAPAPTASRPEPAKAAPPPPPPPPAKAKAKAKSADPAGEPDAGRKMDDAPAVRAQTGVASEPPPSSFADTAKSAPAAEPNGGNGKAAVAGEEPKAEANSDYRIRIPVPLDPSEHLELTLAAARSGRSCQEIIVEALFRYLEDIAGPPDRPTAPGPEGQR